MKKIIKYILVILLFLLFSSNVSAETYEMSENVFESMNYESLNLGISKLDSYDINNNSISEVNINSNLMGFLIDYNNKNTITYESDINSEKPYLLKLAYKNVTKVGSRTVDVNVYITRIYLSNFWSNGSYSNDAGAAFAHVTDNAIWIGSEFDSSSYRYSAHQEVDVTTEIIWSDDHTVVDLPFLNTQSDIDIHYNSSSNKTKEKWQAISGYVGDYYIFENSTLAKDSNDIWYNTGSNTDGDDEYLKTGVYAPTINGRFSSKFYAGVCGSKIQISMQSFTSPTKSSKIVGLDNNVKNQVDSINDKIVYTLSQKFGELYVSVFVPYNSLSIIDTLDTNLKYEASEVLLVDGDNVIDITSNSEYGELSYNYTTRKIEYSLNPTWLSDINNYNGQIITINITTSLNEINRNFTNVGTTILDSITFPSNMVENIYVKKSVTYKYVSGTNGKELPSDICTTTGEYSINDSNEYLIGENVIRDNSIPINTKYDVYKDNVFVGSWILKNWDNDSSIMDNDGVTFIGTWVYEGLDKMPTYKYVSGTQDRELPKEIATNAGDYIINDNNSYLVGEKVDRNDTVKVGTIYKVYENNIHVGSWILDSWNKDSETMDEDGIEFVGIWKYIVNEEINNPKTADNLAKNLVLFLISTTGLLYGVSIYRKRREIY